MTGAYISRRPRRNQSPAFKVKVAVAAMNGKKTLAELAQLYDVHANQITTWRTLLLKGVVGVLGADGATEVAEPPIDVKTLHATIGELTLANVFRGARPKFPGHGPVCCRAQNDDRPFARAAVEAAGPATGDQPG